MAPTTSRRYAPGDLIYESKPYIRVIGSHLLEISCSWCLKHDVELKRCSRCKIVRYCGVACQKEAWKDHKLECPFLPRYIAGQDHFLVQMVASLILKTKGKNWKSITDEVMGQTVSLDDLKFQNFQLMRKPWFRIYLKVTEIALKSYLGEENVPNEETLFKLIGKVECNHYSFGEERTEISALFIGKKIVGYIAEEITSSIFADCITLTSIRDIQGKGTPFADELASKFDHSCVPNANVHFNGKSIQIKAIKKINRFEKVTFSYCRMFSDLGASSAHLNMKNSFGEKGCYCSDCSQPYGKSPLTNILDPLGAICILEETEGLLLMASLMAKYKYPMEWFSQERLKQLLKKQEGILEDTNLARIRLLALKCLLLNGNNLEMREELLTLANWVKRVWGENYEELTEIYKKLIEVNAVLNDKESCERYVKELFRLKMICVGKEDAVNEACESFKNFLFTI